MKTECEIVKTGISKNPVNGLHKKKTEVFK